MHFEFERWAHSRTCIPNGWSLWRGCHQYINIWNCCRSSNWKCTQWSQLHSFGLWNYWCWQILYNVWQTLQSSLWKVFRVVRNNSFDIWVFSKLAVRGVEHKDHSFIFVDLQWAGFWFVPTSATKSSSVWGSSPGGGCSGSDRVIIDIFRECSGVDRWGEPEKSYRWDKSKWSVLQIPCNCYHQCWKKSSWNWTVLFC